MHSSQLDSHWQFFLITLQFTWLIMIQLRCLQYIEFTNFWYHLALPTLICNVCFKTKHILSKSTYAPCYIRMLIKFPGLIFHDLTSKKIHGSLYFGGELFSWTWLTSLVWSYLFSCTALSTGDEKRPYKKPHQTDGLPLLMYRLTVSNINKKLIPSLLSYSGIIAI